MINTIETNRLILRAPVLTDAKAFYSYAKKTNIGPTAGWLPHLNIKESIEILKDFIKKEDTWAITIKPNDELVGTIALTVRDFDEAINGICELGYAIDDIYWNQGYVSEAVKAVIDYSFDIYKVNKIIIGHSINNKASQKIILKNNFKFTHIDKSRTFANEDIKEVYMYELINNRNEEEK